ncbi:Cilia- and flagella-associated protein 43 [Acipenser ruthenus]|uniref:Cilia-and flagella-associated protein 43 n=1 Tax=Acipenser ruthenus TaxID=7906 RepID=A0A444TWW8_ACIRT|nr:Cilia- and flagella-associated protein 43 [Acipenser ruthenus]
MTCFFSEMSESVLSLCCTSRAIKEESLEFTDTKKSLRKGIKELQRAIQAMMRENESLPEIEKLEQQEFNLDVEEQNRLQVEGEQEVARDVIHSVKLAFNKKFESIFKQKEQEINRVKDKNQRLLEILTELDLKEKLWEPELCDNEKPEQALTVDVSEEIPQPEFMSKPEAQWLEDEKKQFKEYEKKVKELNEEREKYRKTLGEQKIASMVESKDFRTGIIQQEWEHMRMRMQMEDLNNKARDIQMLKVSRELQVVKSYNQ